MCKPPDPEVFEKMDRDEQINTLYGVVLKLAARARFTNRWGFWAMSALLLPSVAVVRMDREEQIGRIDRLEDRVEQRAVQDSMIQSQILHEIKGLRDILDELHPRGIR